VPALLAFWGASLCKSLKGGLVVVGGFNLGGLDPVHNAVRVAELAVEKEVERWRLPISARCQLYDHSDEMATKLTMAFHEELQDALLETLGD
jgi:ATP-dependent Lon protease